MFKKPLNPTIWALLFAATLSEANPRDATDEMDPSMRIVTATEGSSCAGFEPYSRAQLFIDHPNKSVVDELICMDGIWRPARLDFKKTCGLTINTVNVFRCIGHDPRISCPWTEVISPYEMPSANPSFNATYVPPNTMYTCYIK